jgi:hypothetical protein
MIRGDISNETPPRIIVIIDVVAETGTKEVRTGFRQKQIQSFVTKLNLAALSHLWNIGNKYGMSIELAAFADSGWDQENLDKMMSTLERRITNPFNYAEIYTDIDDFISILPYRANLKGVVDIRERVARYGSYGVEIDNL